VLASHACKRDEGCWKDSDCKGDRICDGDRGVCVEPSARATGAATATAAPSASAVATAASPASNAPTGDPGTAASADDAGAAEVDIEDGRAAASVAVSGGAVPNAMVVVRRLTPRFRMCYAQGLKNDPDLGGSVTLVAMVNAKGAVDSVSGGASPALAAIVPCLKAAVAGALFAPPQGGRAIVSIPITFVKQ
jgi:hypothetical protein